MSAQMRRAHSGNPFRRMEREISTVELDFCAHTTVFCLGVLSFLSNNTTQRPLSPQAAVDDACCFFFYSNSQEEKKKEKIKGRKAKEPPECLLCLAHGPCGRAQLDVNSSYRGPRGWGSPQGTALLPRKLLLTAHRPCCSSWQQQATRTFPRGFACSQQQGGPSQAQSS